MHDLAGARMAVAAPERMSTSKMGGHDSFDDVVRYAEAHNVNNRIAAYMLAIDRVAFTIRQRGIYA